MRIDCDECAMQHTTACDECIVTVLLDGPRLLDESASRAGVELDAGEAEALGHLADAGLVAPLRLVPRKHPAAASEDDAAAG